MSSQLPSDPLALAARQIRIRPDLEATLASIVQAAVASVPDIDHAGISVVPGDGAAEPGAWTDSFVHELDQLQEALVEGPASEALRSDEVIVVNDLATEQRWPNYVPQAVRVGVTAQVSVRLFSSGQVLGCLNLYAMRRSTIDAGIVPMVRLFAVHAGLALERAQREAELNDLVATRQALGQAVGLVMERYQVDQERAYQFLIRFSRGSNTNLRRVAEDLIAAANEKYAVVPEEEPPTDAHAPGPGRRATRRGVSQLARP